MSLAAILAVLLLLVGVAWFWRERRLAEQRRQEKRDMVARLAAQQQEIRAEAQAQQRAVFDSMADGVLLLDAEGRVQLMNAALCRLLSLSGTFRQGAKLIEAIRLPALAGLVDRVRQENTVVGFELEVPRTPPRVLEVNASAVRDREGAYRSAILLFHDLTRVKQLESNRKEFVANVSHELRTPLSLIKGFVETLLDGAKDDPEIATRYLQTIQRHTDRLTKLIEDLLTISQLESGQVVLNLEQLSLRTVAERAIEGLQLRAAEKETEVRNEIPDDVTVPADADRLEQVLCNLVENAVKYGRAKGQVRVGGERRGMSHVAVWVSDDGPGIPAEAQARIFERFYRIDRARSRETGGTGLGLAIVKHIILAHGGNVWVESKPNQGATFYLTLPQSGKKTAPTR